MRVVILIIIFLLLGFGVGALLQPAPPKPQLVKPVHKPIPTLAPLSAEKLTALVNDWRVSQGFQPYIQNETLCEIARDRIKAGLDYHKGLYEKYSNYPSMISENSAWKTVDEENTLVGWLQSPTHRTNLEKLYKYSCIVTDKSNALQIFSNLENGTR